MISEIDIYRSANELIKQHGEDAAVQAAMKADKFLAAGDFEGAVVWRQILRTIDELERREPNLNEAEH